VRQQNFCLHPCPDPFCEPFQLVSLFLDLGGWFVCVCPDDPPLIVLPLLFFTVNARTKDVVDHRFLSLHPPSCSSVLFARLPYTCSAWGEQSGKNGSLLELRVPSFSVYQGPLVPLGPPLPWYGYFFLFTDVLFGVRFVCPIQKLSFRFESWVHRSILFRFQVRHSKRFS